MVTCPQRTLHWTVLQKFLWWKELSMRHSCKYDTGVLLVTFPKEVKKKVPEEK